jgi:hypothetical protein
MQTLGTVVNPSRFQSSYTVTNVGPIQSNNIGITSPSLIDSSKDQDFQFFYAIKTCLIQYNSSSLVQSLPSSPLNDFHLYWLCSLATTKEEARGLVHHILSTYTIQVDPVIKSYYLQKMDRLLGMDLKDAKDKNI